MQNPEKHYQHFIFDNARWKGFEFRDDDILICTPYKAGTTWTQMICGLLVFQKTEFDKPLAAISPWLEMNDDPKEVTFKTLSDQAHRRFIKTHTPFDGLPRRDDISYLVVQRDPRDVYFSMRNHQANMDWNSRAIFAQQVRESGQMPPPPPEDPNELFPTWLTVGMFEWEQDGFPFWSLFHHAETFWEVRNNPNVHFIHYANLKSDLEGEMRKIAAFLKIKVPEEKWPALVEAATFASMKKNADRVAPDTEHSMWKSNSSFFNKGTSGQWRGQLTDENVVLYNKITRERYPHDMLDWLENGGALKG